MPLNLEGVEPKESKGFAPIPEGIYPFRITKGEEKIATTEGKNDSHNFQLTIQFGEHEGRIAFANFSLTEKMAGFIRHWYNVIGATNFKELNPADYIGKPLRAEVMNEEYNGKVTSKVRLGCYFPWDGNEATAFGGDAPAAATKSTPAPAASSAASKPVAGKGSPFSNKGPATKTGKALGAASDADQPPF